MRTKRGRATRTRAHSTRYAECAHVVWTDLGEVQAMEIYIDDVPWKDDLVTYVPAIEDGHLLLPPGSGWGADLNDEVILARPQKSF
jgi:L-alanine-DL-glutamate epimerase-like enolase superfamily enzyme